MNIALAWAEILSNAALFGAILFGLGWPVIRLWPGNHVEKLAVGGASALVIVYLAAFVIYWTGVSRGLFYLLPGGALLVGVARFRQMRDFLRAPDLRQCLLGLTVLSIWMLGWQATIRTYWGGGWAGDWIEHFDRVHFFISRWDPDTPFLNVYKLPARPPFANLVVGAFMAVTRADYWHFQVFSALFSCLIWVPAVLLATRFSPHRAVASVLLIALMLNPCFVQNAAFPWTKLPTAAFVLLALHLFLGAWEEQRPLLYEVSFACLAVAAVIHYSAGPFIVTLVGVYFALHRRQLLDQSFWRRTLRIAGVCSVLLATWFAWSIATYGASGTFLATTVTTTRDTASGVAEVVKIVANIWNTLVPPMLRNTHVGSVLWQSAPLPLLRDQFFVLYQTNLIFAMGSTAGFAAIILGLRQARGATPSRRRFWLWFIGVTVALGIGAHGAFDYLGLAHICLQPVILLGVCFVASQLPTLPRPWQRMLCLGYVLDLALGIVFHFALQHHDLRADLSPLSFSQAVELIGLNGAHNFVEQFRRPIDFLGGREANNLAIIVPLLISLAALTLYRAVRACRAAPASALAAQA